MLLWLLSSFQSTISRISSEFRRQLIGSVDRSSVVSAPVSLVGLQEALKNS